MNEEQEGQCLLCARKHLAAAQELAQEYALGHRRSGWRAVGHLTLCEGHTYIRWPDLALAVRELRLRWMDYLDGGARATLELDQLLDDMSDIQEGETNGSADDNAGDGARAVRRGPHPELESAARA